MHKRAKASESENATNKGIQRLKKKMQRKSLGEMQLRQEAQVGWVNAPMATTTHTCDDHDDHNDDDDHKGEDNNAKRCVW